jgi:Ni/Fe-hydrogenase 1 B-type cytochrome subunit
MNATAHSAVKAPSPLARGEDLVRVYIWEKPVRLTHWVIFFAIFVLGFTGYYMYRPFIISRDGSVFLMAEMRFVHEVTAFVFIAALLLRFYWFFTGYGWAHWTGFVSAQRWWRRALWRQLKYYLFLRPGPSTHLGHNPLAAITYLFVFALMVIEIITGMALLDYSGGLGHGALAFCFGWITSLLSIQYVREIHFLIMFAFLAFVIHHVYSAVLISMEEGTGLMDGIFSGYKFFPARCIATEPTRRPGEGRVRKSVIVRGLEATPRGGSPSGKSGKKVTVPTPPSGSGTKSAS